MSFSIDRRPQLEDEKGKGEEEKEKNEEREEFDEETQRVARINIQDHTECQQRGYPSEEDLRDCIQWLGREDHPEVVYPWDHKRQLLIPLSSQPGAPTTDEDTIEAWMKTIGMMIFREGDASEPLEECKIFLLETLWQQMNDLLKKCWKRAREDGREVISYEDVIWQLRNASNRMWRLIAHAIQEQVNDHREATSEPKQREKVGRDVENDPGHGILLILQRLHPNIHRRAVFFKNSSEQLYRAVATVNEEMLLLCAKPRPSYDTPRERSRRKRLAFRDAHLEEEEKALLDEASEESFAYSRGKRIGSMAARFHRFLGRPPLDKDLIFVLDFLAREIITDLVDAASRLRDIELESDVFEDTWHGSSEDCIQIRHYERAFEEHPGVRSKNDVLFGADEDSYKPREEREKRRREAERALLKRHASRRDEDPIRKKSRDVTSDDEEEEEEEQTLSLFEPSADEGEEAAFGRAATSKSM